MHSKWNYRPGTYPRTRVSTSFNVDSTLAEMRGCLDGMNEDGLVASLTAGGSFARGPGFSVILMLRYVLETCRGVDEALCGYWIPLE